VLLAGLLAGLLLLLLEGLFAAHQAALAAAGVATALILVQLQPTELLSLLLGLQLLPVWLVLLRELLLLLLLLLSFWPRASLLCFCRSRLRTSGGCLLVCACRHGELAQEKSKPIQIDHQH
jgi:hypothetical protein